MDIADQSGEVTDLFTRSAMYQHSLKVQQQVQTIPTCEHCEENPPEVTILGVTMRYCRRCIKELELMDI